jgi:acyl-CoA thioesterase YciA
MSEKCLPTDVMPVLRVLAKPADANPGGSIFGGWVMSNVDIAGSVPALERARGPVVTRAVDSFEFSKPIRIGDLVSFYASIVSTGRTSIRVQVDVYVERFHSGMISCEKVTQATLVYVAIDEYCKPRALSD